MKIWESTVKVEMQFMLYHVWYNVLLGSDVLSRTASHVLPVPVSFAGEWKPGKLSAADVEASSPLPYSPASAVLFKYSRAAMLLATLRVLLLLLAPNNCGALPCAGYDAVHQ